MINDCIDMTMIVYAVICVWIQGSEVNWTHVALGSTHRSSRHFGQLEDHLHGIANFIIALSLRAAAAF